MTEVEDAYLVETRGLGSDDVGYALWPSDGSALRQWVRADLATRLRREDAVKLAKRVRKNLHIPARVVKAIKARGT